MINYKNPAKRMLQTVVPHDLAAAVEAAARDDGRSISSMMERILTQWHEQQSDSVKRRWANKLGVSGHATKCIHCGCWFNAAGKRAGSGFCSDEHRIAFIDSLKPTKDTAKDAGREKS